MRSEALPTLIAKLREPEHRSDFIASTIALLSTFAREVGEDQLVRLVKMDVVGYLVLAINP